MRFEDVVSILERSFSLELKIVQDTTVFEVAGGDGSTKVRILLQGESEHKLVLMSADLGEAPPEGRERLFQTMLEANNTFSGTAGATLALDAVSRVARLQRYVPSDDLANDVMGHIKPFVETALLWSRLIADYRPSADPSGDSLGEWKARGAESFHMIHV